MNRYYIRARFMNDGGRSEVFYLRNRQDTTTPGRKHYPSVQWLDESEFAEIDKQSATFNDENVWKWARWVFKTAAVSVEVVRIEQ